MSRPRHRYTVRMYGASRKPIVSADYETPEAALAAWQVALADVGHDDDSIAGRLASWTAVLMAGGRGLNVLNPDLEGSVEINISTTLSTTRPESG